MAARLLGRRAHATSELRRRLEAMGYQAATAARTVERCVALGWMDDADLARRRAAALRARGAGSLRIAADLDGRGLSPAIAEEAIVESLAGRSEAAWARDALEVARIEAARAPARAWRLLIGRGFPEDVVADVVGDPM